LTWAFAVAVIFFSAPQASDSSRATYVEDGANLPETVFFFFSMFIPPSTIGLSFAPCLRKGLFPLLTLH